MDKRTFFKSVLLGVAGVYASGLIVRAAKANKKWDGVFRMPELSFPPDSLEPFIDAGTLKLHLQYHAACTDGLNAAVTASGLKGKTAHELMRMSSEFPPEIRNLAGGYVNHKLFWRILKPGGNEPSYEFSRIVERDFGSFDNLSVKFSEASRTFSGPGWVWLIASKNGKLRITSTENNDNPFMDVAKERGFPLMCLDVWDHAYSNRNHRDTGYIGAFFGVINWEIVSRRYKSASKTGFSI